MNPSSRTLSVPLWCKSNYSFLEGASSPEELVEQASAYDLSALGLTDTNGVYGTVRAFAAWRAAGGEGIGRHEYLARPLVGAQVTLEPAEDSAGGSVLLFARDRDGYGNLCELLSAGHLRSPKGTSSLSPFEIAERCGGLTLVLVPAFDYPPAGSLNVLREAFAGRIYTGIARHYRADDPQLERRGRSIAEAYDIPCVATPEVLYHAPERRALGDVMTCISHGCTLEEAGSRLRPNGEFALKTRSAMWSLYRDSPELLARTCEIAESAAFSLSQLHYRYPDEWLPGGYTSSGRLHKLTWSGARSRYPEGIPHSVTEQLRRELAIIDELDYCGYFLTMYEIVEYCRSRGILCQGRGSAANSAVCYCLGITAVDPVRMRLLFERFLSKERAEPPDIDLDIEHDRREEVIEFMYERYGRRHAAMVANVVRYRPRSAVREVGKVLGFPETTLDRIARLAPHRDTSLADSVRETGLDPETGVARLLVTLCEQIIGAPRHLSIHPGGFLLGNEPVTRIVPVENATMPGRTVIQWDKTDIETLNLFKVDLLGLGALSHLDYCFRLLETHRGVRMGMADIPPDDPGVFAMLTRGDTIGIFQLESRAQMAMLPRMAPRRYYDIVIEISIVRPGPISGGMVHPYLRRRHGEEPVVYPHPSLKPVLEKTLGVPLFQEQVMKLAVLAADYTPGEADQLRRDMAAWRKTGRMEKHRTALIERMTAKGIERPFAERVFDQIRGFGEYGFPESHAASFALIAYATAWVRYYYPVEFYCGLLNAWPMGFYSPATIVEDARRHGVGVREADIYRSEWFCTLEPVQNTSALRMGLRFIKGLGENDYDRIAAERSLQFASVEAFLRRTGIHENVAVALAESGALRPLGVSRRSALWRSYGHRRRAADQGSDSQGSDSGTRNVTSEFPFAEEQTLPHFKTLSAWERVVWDYGVSGYSTSGHPLEGMRDELARDGIPEASALRGKKDGESVRYAGLVICRQRPENAGGTLFMTLEDESGFVNIIVRRNVLNAYRALAFTRSFLGISGVLQAHPSSPYILAESLWQPVLSRRPAAGASHDFH